MSKRTKKILKGGGTYSYNFPVAHDKILRSRNHGQKQIRQMRGIKRISVSGRETMDDDGSVRVIITADTKKDADDAYKYALSLIPSTSKLMSRKRSGFNSNTSITKEDIIIRLEEIINDIRKL
tara:strand:+ start:331 stop:699 length:369 start_codon:yes stop_codon:yes gene_type:complete